MTKYGSRFWLEKMSARRSIRDHYRDKFFSDHGFSNRLGDPFELESNPSQQMSVVMDLIKDAQKCIDSDSSAIEALKLGISSSMLGSASTASIPKLPISINQMSMSSLANKHFCSSGSE